MFNSVTDYENDVIVNSISNDIIISNINDQINNFKSQDISSNLMNDLNNKFNFLIKVKYQDDPSNIIDVKNSTFVAFFKSLKKVIGIDSDISPETLGHEKFAMYIIGIYEFFIINYKKNHITFFVNEVIDRKKYFSKTYKDETLEKKDLKFSNTRKYFRNTENTIIILNFSLILLEILENHYFDDYIKTLIENDENEFTSLIIKNIFIENSDINTLNKKFLNNYKLKLDDNIYPEISYNAENIIRSNFISNLNESKE